MRFFKRMRKAMQAMMLVEELAVRWPSVEVAVRKEHPEFAAAVDQLADLFHRNRDLLGGRK